MNSKEVKSRFLDYFTQRDHMLIKSSSLIPQGDPSLLFINSGMAPMKPYFTGQAKPPHPRLTNIQPCIRTNDIDDVGDMHHLTFFQMLGSWSIGDYYKMEAITLANNLLVDEFKIPKEDLYVTVYKGSPELGIPYDEESHKAWLEMGIPESRIVPLGEDNFWGPAGNYGPCGPCTEVFIDTQKGTKEGSYEAGGEFDTKNRYMEIWNAGVFMQYYQNTEGQLSPLQMKSVDTGAGLERLVMAMNGVKSVYETDIYKNVNTVIHSYIPQSTDANTIKNTRIIADHVRAASFIISEGVLPDRNGQAYIPRRLIRRALTSAYILDCPQFSFNDAVDAVVDTDAADYPLLDNSRDTVKTAFANEAKSFMKVIHNGHKAIKKQLVKTAGIITGQDGFAITSSLGVPLDVLASLAAKENATLDLQAYQQAADTHKVVSKNGPLQQ